MDDRAEYLTTFQIWFSRLRQLLLIEDYPEPDQDVAWIYFAEGESAEGCAISIVTQYKRILHER